MDDFQSIFEDPAEFSSGASSTSVSLLLRAQIRDDSAWRQLVNLYGPMIYYWCVQRGVNACDAEDLVQEVFTSVSRSLPEFQRGPATGSFRSWLKIISQNKVGDFFRRKRIEPKSFTQQKMMAVVDRPKASEVEAEEDRAMVLRALSMIQNEFPDQEWKAFWNSMVVGRDPADVAAELNVSRNVVYLARSRVLRRLREEFEDLLS